MVYMATAELNESLWPESRLISITIYPDYKAYSQHSHVPRINVATTKVLVLKRHLSELYLRYMSSYIYPTTNLTAKINK